MNRCRSKLGQLFFGRWGSKIALGTALSAALLVGCPAPDQTPGRITPVVNAGADQVVNAGARVTLDGSGSNDADGDALDFSWKQTLGSPVTLSSTTAAVVGFTAPAQGTWLVFELTVSNGTTSAADMVNVSVHPVDALAEIRELRQPSILNDPAVTGNFPAGWTVGPPPQPLAPAGDQEEISQIQLAPVVEEDLAPGASREVVWDVAGPAGLSASVRWVGTRDPLQVSMSLNDTALATGDSYAYGQDRGGSYIKALGNTGGRVTLTVVNTSSATVRVKIALGARNL